MKLNLKKKIGFVIKKYIKTYSHMYLKKGYSHMYSRKNQRNPQKLFSGSISGRLSGSGKAVLEFYNDLVKLWVAPLLLSHLHVVLVQKMLICHHVNQLVPVVVLTMIETNWMKITVIKIKNL